MNMPSSKIIAAVVGGLVVIGGVVLVSEFSGNKDDANIGRERGRGRDRGDNADAARKGRGRPSASGERPGGIPSGRGAIKACPDEKTVEDAAIKADPEYIKSHFANKFCAKAGSGQLTSCQDGDQKSCDERVNPPSRRSRSNVQCVARPAEVFCSSHKLATDTLVTTCFDVKSDCDTFHERKHTLPRVCRMAPACEKVTLPPL
jgi:hypothetical protein